MKGMVMMLRALFEALGIQVSEQDATAIQEIIPTLPAKVEQTVKVIDEAIKHFDERLTAIEKRLEEMSYGRTSGNVQ